MSGQIPALAGGVLTIPKGVSRLDPGNKAGNVTARWLSYRGGPFCNICQNPVNLFDFMAHGGTCEKHRSYGLNGVAWVYQCPY